jgi:hypothetical protein
MAHVLPGKTDLERSSEIVEVAPEVVYEATL